MNDRAAPGTNSVVAPAPCGTEQYIPQSNGAERALPDLLQDALLAAVRGPRVWCDNNGDFIQFLTTRGVVSVELEGEHLDVDELRSRFALYRDLVHKRVRGVLDNCLPRTLRALGSELDVTLEHFVREGSWASPHLRDLVAEFVRFGCGHWSKHPGLVPHLSDLARYEWARLEVGSALDDSALEVSEISPQVTLCLRASTRLLQLEHAVHLTGEGDPPPRAGKFNVLVHRDAAYDVFTLELSDLAAAVIDALEAGHPLARAAEQALAATGLTSSPHHVAEVAALLNDLFTRSVFGRRAVAAPA